MLEGNTHNLFGLSLYQGSEWHHVWSLSQTDEGSERHHGPRVKRTTTANGGNISTTAIGATTTRSWPLDAVDYHFAYLVSFSIVVIGFIASVFLDCVPVAKRKTCQALEGVKKGVTYFASTAAGGVLWVDSRFWDSSAGTPVRQCSSIQKEYVDYGTVLVGFVQVPWKVSRLV